MENKKYIYRLVGINNSNKAQIKKIEYNLNEKSIPEDEEILNKQIMENIKLKLYRCRINENINLKKIPLYYISLYYERKFITGYLFSVYIYFENMTDITNDNLDDILNLKLEGKYYIEIQIDDKTEIIYLDNYTDENSMMINMIELTETDELKDIIKIEISKRDEERRQRFGDMQITEPRKPKYNFNELLKKYEETGIIDDVFNK